MKESFADHPVSLAEIRATKEDNATLWSPRDVLIDALRKIDAGEDSPKALVVIWTEDEPDGAVTVGHAVSCRNLVEAAGMTARILHRLNRDADE